MVQKQLVTINEYERLYDAFVQSECRAARAAENEAHHRIHDLQMAPAASGTLSARIDAFLAEHRERVDAFRHAEQAANKAQIEANRAFVAYAQEHLEVVPGLPR